METKHLNRIGYACLNLDISPNKYKTCRQKNLTQEKLEELISHNLDVLETTIDYNIQNNIKLFRVSSSLIPFGSSPLNQVDWVNLFKVKLKKISDKIKEAGMRISVHPGQYTVINSLDEDVVNRSIADLEYHAEILDSLDDSSTNKMILHIGGTYGNKEEAIQRFIDVYLNRLSIKVKKYLVIENDDKSFNIEDVLYISRQTGAPVIFDNLHHEINKAMKKETVDYFNEAVTTWQKCDGVSKIHYSQQAINKKIGSHSETIDLDLFYNFINGLPNASVDVMLEVKDKNRSAIKVLSSLNNK